MSDKQECVHETSDLDEATYLRAIKRYPVLGHRFDGHTLHIRFAISAEDAQKSKEDYLNSDFPIYNTTKRNFMRLLRR